MNTAYRKTVAGKHSKRKEAVSCPIMSHFKGYDKDTKYCCYHKLREMIPAEYSCCSKDGKSCLVTQIPSQKEGCVNLIEELNFYEYYGIPIDELYIRRQVQRFFAATNEDAERKIAHQRSV